MYVLGLLGKISILFDNVLQVEDFSSKKWSLSVFASGCARDC